MRNPRRYDEIASRFPSYFEFSRERPVAVDMIHFSEPASPAPLAGVLFAYLPRWCAARRHDKSILDKSILDSFIQAALSGISSGISSPEKEREPLAPRQVPRHPLARNRWPGQHEGGCDNTRGDHES